MAGILPSPIDPLRSPNNRRSCWDVESWVKAAEDLSTAADDLGIPRAPKLTYTLYPSRAWANWLMGVLALCGICAAWWLAVFGH